MLYNHELVRKLRYGAAGISAFFLGYAILTFRDQRISTTRLILIISCLAVSVLCAWLLKKANKRDFFIYAASMLLVVIMMLFRIRANIALDLTLLLLTVGVATAIWFQIRKKNAFA